MRTTIDLPDELFRKVKSAAALKGQSLRQFVEAALAGVISDEESGDYGHDRPFPVSIAPKGRKIKSFTNAEIDEIFLREDMEKYDS
ncbi:MAG: hypothetical protein ABIV13_00585 [Fimbriimonadales bacterium]